MSHGLDLRKEVLDTSEEDWQFGATSKVCLAFIAEDERERFLPPGELQYGKEDFMSCATLAPINILEEKFNHLYQRSLLSKENRTWLENKGYVDNGHVQFSNRFNAIKSGTTRSGNSLIAPLKSIRHDGLIPKSLLPANSQMTFTEYHNEKDITTDMEFIGHEFAKRFSISYERVLEKDYPILLAEDSLDVAAFAWPKPVEGVYPRTDNNPNHAFMVFKRQYFAFDNYIDSTDGDYIKHLTEDYNFLDYGYRVYIDAENVIQRSPCKDFISWLLSYSV